MAAQKDTPKECADEWLKKWKPQCWVCKTDEGGWDFAGIVLGRVFPNGEDGKTGGMNAPVARFECKKCRTILEVDCSTAGIRSSPKQ